LIGLQLADLDLEHGRALVTEKGKKSRFLFITSATISALREWLAVRQSSKEFVFVNRCGEPFTVWGVYQALGLHNQDIVRRFSARL
jgi:site-specific recombinase XerC